VSGARHLLLQLEPMKAVTLALIFLGLVAGCAAPAVTITGASPTERPDLMYTSPTECNKAGHTWNTTAGVCM
jgi:hypothetical protein